MVVRIPIYISGGFSNHDILPKQPSLSTVRIVLAYKIFSNGKFSGVYGEHVRQVKAELKILISNSFDQCIFAISFIFYIYVILFNIISCYYIFS